MVINSYNAFLTILLLFSTLNNFSICNAQPGIKNIDHQICSGPKIEWLSEITSNSIDSTNNGFFNALVNLIFGKDDLIILKPFNLVTDSNNTIFFVDQDSKKLFKYSFEENELESLLDDDYKLKSPVGLYLTETDAFITDSELNTIFKYNFETEITSVFTSSLDQPTGIIYLENSKEFWVCETIKHRIVRLNNKGEIIGSIGQRGLDGGQFNFPTFIWAAKNGFIYVNDSMNFRIQIFSLDGKYVNQFGKAGDGSGDFTRPKGIATDSFDNIYVVDALFNNIQVFDQVGHLLYTFGGQGIESGLFWLPAGIFIDNQNKIYVADSFNSRIQIFQLKCEN